MAATVGGISKDRATIDLNKQLTAANNAAAFKNVEPNILKSYTNVTYLFTLLPLTPTELDQVQSDGSLSSLIKNVVFSSAGRYDNLRVSTFFGSPEYFINNVEINTFATPTRKSGLSGNLTINFEIVEPYSIGLFLQSLQNSAVRSGYNSYIECPFLLRVEFVGTNPSTNTQEVIPGSVRDYPLKITGVAFTSNEGGSKYTVRCLDFNLDAFNNVYGTFFGTASVKGKTVKEAIESLKTVLNNDQNTQKNSKMIELADEYDFVLDPEIADSQFVAADDQPSAPGNNSNSTKNGSESGRGSKVAGERTFNWPKAENGRRIIDMISEIMKSSEYCTKNLIPSNVDKNTGYIKWYRPSAKLSYLGNKFKLDKIQNRPAYKITYAVKIYRVHHSVFKLPSQYSYGFAPEQIPASIKKKYDYIYTGLNDDIIRWELKFDNTFYTAIPSSPFGNQPGDINANGKAVSETKGRGNEAGTNTAGLTSITPAGKVLQDSKASYRKPLGGSTVDNVDIRIARAFEESLLVETDMIMLDLTILGDPYYLTKSGVFIDRVGPASDGSQVNNDKTMATEDGEVRIYLRFKSPIDAPAYGSSLYIFPSAGYTDSPYSGLYKIRFVKSKFSDGVFTQELNLFRDRGQQVEEIQNAIRDPFLSIAGDGSAPSANETTVNTFPPKASFNTQQNKGLTE